MRIPTILAIFAISAAALGGCSLRYDQAMELEPKGSAFDKALYAGYLQMARAELDELDLDDTDKFADRAARAASGRAPAPEKLTARALPAHKTGDLGAARVKLVTALAGGAAKRHPADAARAQLRFDCWMQEQEENFQPDDIVQCRTGFFAALEKIGSPSHAAVRPATTTGPRAGLRPASAPAPTRAEAKAGYVVLFDFNKSGMGADARRIVETAIKTAKRLGAAAIRISGHADRAGGRAYNKGLSKRRAEAIATALIRAGIKKEKIRVEAFGEDKPAVQTPDGMREPRNRRVEIGIDTTPPRTAQRQLPPGPSPGGGRWGAVVS